MNDISINPMTRCIEVSDTNKNKEKKQRLYNKIVRAISNMKKKQRFYIKIVYLKLNFHFEECYLKKYYKRVFEIEVQRDLLFFILAFFSFRKTILFFLRK